MKSLKGRSGIIAKGITESVMTVWTKTMHRCAEVTDKLDLNLVSRAKPFLRCRKLMALDSGLVDVNDVFTSDKPEEVAIHKQMDNQCY